jgi:hypothetical protein
VPGGETTVYRQLFPQEHIPMVLSSVIQAGSTLRKVSETEFENPITIRLCRIMIQIPAFRDGPLDIRPQTGIISLDDDADNLAGAADILVSCGFGHQVYFVLEAKRLRVRLPDGRQKSGNSEYIKEGMMRFVSGQYAPLMETSAMIGYVFDGKIDEARAGIDQAVQHKAEELKLKSPKKLMPSPILPGDTVDETNHDLNTRSFTIYHIFVSV